MRPKIHIQHWGHMREFSNGKWRLMTGACVTAAFIALFYKP